MTISSKPESSGFGVRVDGRDAGISFAKYADAEGAANRLFADGYRHIEIFDRPSGRVIEQVGPSRATA
jgi:hypothetical protein